MSLLDRRAYIWEPMVHVFHVVSARPLHTIISLISRSSRSPYRGQPLREESSLLSVGRGRHGLLQVVGMLRQTFMRVHIHIGELNPASYMNTHVSAVCLSNFV